MGKRCLALSVGDSAEKYRELGGRGLGDVAGTAPADDFRLDVRMGEVIERHVGKVEHALGKHDVGRGKVLRQLRQEVTAHDKPRDVDVATVIVVVDGMLPYMRLQVPLSA